MTLIEMLKEEIKKIEAMPECMNAIPFIRDDTTSIMICAIYKDRKMHYILPDRSIVIMFIDDLLQILKKGGLEKSQEIYKSQILKPLLDKKEFEL